MSAAHEPPSREGGFWSERTLKAKKEACGISAGTRETYILKGGSCDLLYRAIMKKR